MPQSQSRISQYYAAHGDKVRYLVVGVFNTAFGYALFLVMLALSEAVIAAVPAGTLPDIVVKNHYLIAQWTAWVLSVPVGTFTLKRFVFHGKDRYLSEVRRAYLVYLPGLALSSLLLWFTVEVIGLSPEIGQLITIGMVVWFSYLGHKYFTFRRPSDATDDDAVSAR